jgi:carboxyl-terminal processing protease
MARAKKYGSLIIDMRGNSGGDEETLRRLVANVFDHDIKLADLKGRKELKPLVAKTRGRDVYTGKLVVLVDSESASASEMFARVVQLEKRGTVIGDKTPGAVMRSRYFGHAAGVDVVAYYGASIPDADAIMADGTSLERVGVKPDELVLPTAQDLAARRDPVLARAAALLGVELKPEKAGELFPLEWRK